MTNMNSNNLPQTVSKRLRLRRQNHSTEMISALNACLQEECFTDACLLCEERTIKVHRIILSLFSQFFKRTFQSLQTSNMCNSPVVVVIKNLPFIDLKAIVEFIYNGEVAIPQDQLNSLLKSAANLEVEGLNADNTVNATQLPIPDINNKSNAFISTQLTQKLVKPVSLIPEKRAQKRVRISTTKPNIQVLNVPSAANVYQTVVNNKTPISVVQLAPVDSAPKISADIALHKNKVILLQSANKQTPKKQKISINPTVKNLLENKKKTETVSQPNSCLTPVSTNETNTELKSTTPSTSASHPTVENSVGLTKLYELSNDKERKEFLDKLVKFSNDSGNPITRCPTINKLPVDLYKLYLAVKERGGFDTVTIKQLWIECTHSCNIPSTSSAACALQIHYQKHLKPYESRFIEDEAHKLNTDQLNKETKENSETPTVITNSKTQITVAKSHTINGTVAADVTSNTTSNTTSNERSTNQKSNEIEEIWIEDDIEVTPIIKTCSSTQKHSTPSKSSANQNEIIDLNSTPISKASTSQIKVVTPVKTCNLCYMSFANETLLKEHKTKEHKSITKCAVCTKEFANNSLLLLHVKNDNCYQAKNNSFK